MPLPSPAIAAAPGPPADTPIASPVNARSPHLRPVLWSAAITLLIALLILTPPLVNANRFRKKIADSMSKSLGRPVHLDNVSLHLLPIPGFTLQNLVVSEDPDFGAEPTIRANTVEATVRVSSLWRHPVEFSTVRFVDPSINLVRNAEGRWNISEVLLHASRVDSAPTTQGHAGPSLRFPYIEATGGRVNVKFGVEKLPFSLTDADFALWLPSARQWRVRLVGHPARTDTNITDPGTVRVEGELQRAATLTAVPVNFRASWHDAPLGEVTRIVAGSDLGWRGSFNIDATLAGTLGDARLDTKATLGGLRRADFFPAHPLDLQSTCTSAFALHPATLTGLRCTLPAGGPQPLTLGAETVHLQGIASTSTTLQGEAIPLRWALLWAGLFSPRVSSDLRPGGTLDLDIQRAPPAAASNATAASIPQPQGGWSGTVQVNLPPLPQPAAPTPAGPNELLLQVANSPAPGPWPSLHLPPTTLTLSPTSTVTVTGDFGPTGYSLDVNGLATATALRTPARYLPQLGDGLDAVLPASSAADASPVQVRIRCSRSWTTAQVCSNTAPPAPAIRERTPSTPRKKLWQR